MCNSHHDGLIDISNIFMKQFIVSLSLTERHQLLLRIPFIRLHLMKIERNRN